MDSEQAWEFLCGHSVFKDHFKVALDIDVVKVNPENETIDDDEKKNTATRVWLECGPVECEKDDNDRLCAFYSHDIALDCGGKTFEEAIVKLAKLVKRKYGKKQINWANKKETDSFPLSPHSVRSVF